MGTVYVICMNDQLMLAVIGDKEKAERRMGQLRDAHWVANKPQYRYDELVYRNTVYWHIHELDAE